MKLLWFTIIMQIMDFYTFINVKSGLIAANELSPIPKIYGQVPGAVLSRVIMFILIILIWRLFSGKTRVALLGWCSFLGIAGAISNILIGW